MKESIRAAREEVAHNGLVEDLTAIAGITGEGEEEVAELEDLKARRMPADVRAMTQLEVLRRFASRLREHLAALKDPGDPLDEGTVKTLADAGYDSLEAIREAPDEDLLAIKGIGPAKLEEIREKVG